MEGEDSAYRFFRAPSKIEVRVRRSAGTDQGFFEGGIALSKRTFGEAAVYDTHAPPNSRRIVRMLGAEFLLEEDTRWTRHIPKD